VYANWYKRGSVSITANKNDYTFMDKYNMTHDTGGSSKHNSNNQDGAALSV